MLHIKLSFVMRGQIDDFATKEDQFINVNGMLPRITNKVIFGGDLVCNINDAVITLVLGNHKSLDHEDIPFSTSYGDNTKRIPLLQRGYKFELRFTMPNPIWRKLREHRDPR